jgi:hypothetical protein
LLKKQQWAVKGAVTPLSLATLVRHFVLVLLVLLLSCHLFT